MKQSGHKKKPDDNSVDGETEAARIDGDQPIKPAIPGIFHAPSGSARVHFSELLASSGRGADGDEAKKTGIDARGRWTISGLPGARIAAGSRRSEGGVLEILVGRDGELLDATFASPDSHPAERSKAAFAPVGSSAEKHGEPLLSAMPGGADGDAISTAADPSAMSGESESLSELGAQGPPTPLGAQSEDGEKHESPALSSTQTAREPAQRLTTDERIDGARLLAELAPSETGPVELPESIAWQEPKARASGDSAWAGPELALRVSELASIVERMQRVRRVSGHTSTSHRVETIVSPYATTSAVRRSAGGLRERESARR